LPNNNGLEWPVTPVARCQSQMAGCVQPAQTWLQTSTVEKDLHPEEE